MEDDSKEPKKNRFKPYLRTAASHTIIGIVGAVAVYAFYKQRTVITLCHLTMENVDKLKEQGQGVIGFGHGTKNPIYFALPDKQ